MLEYGTVGRGGAVLTVVIFRANSPLQVTLVRVREVFRPLQALILFPNDRTKSSVLPNDTVIL